MDTLIDLLLDTGKYELKDFYLKSVECENDFDELMKKTSYKHQEKFANWFLNKYKDVQTFMTKENWELELDRLSEFEKWEDRNVDLELNDDDIANLNSRIKNEIDDCFKQDKNEIIRKFFLYSRELDRYLGFEFDFVLDTCSIDLINILDEYLYDKYKIRKDCENNVSLEDMSKEELIQEN